MKPVIGQEAVVEHSYMGRITFYLGYKVTKVTPTGRVTITRDSDGFQRNFDAKGREMDKSRYTRNEVRFDVEVVKGIMNHERSVRETIKAIDEIKGFRTPDVRWSKEDLLKTLDEIQAKVDAAREAVNKV